MFKPQECPLPREAACPPSIKYSPRRYLKARVLWRSLFVASLLPGEINVHRSPGLRRSPPRPKWNLLRGKNGLPARPVFPPRIVPDKKILRLSDRTLRSPSIIGAVRLHTVRLYDPLNVNVMGAKSITFLVPLRISMDLYR